MFSKVNTNLCYTFVGFVGEWCHIDFNECAEEPCSSMHYCVDHVDRFECNIHIPKLIASIVCPLLALLVVIYVLRRLLLLLNDRRISRSRYAIVKVFWPSS